MVSGGRTVRRSRLGAALAGLVLALGAPVASAAPFAYVANLNSSSVSQFDAGAGPLAPLTPPTIGAGEFPQDVAVSPDGASVYVANASNVLSANTVAQFSIAANGSLVPSRRRRCPRATRRRASRCAPMARASTSRTRLKARSRS